MGLIKKEPLKASNGVNIGYLLKLSGVIGLESDSKDFAEVYNEFKSVLKNYISEVIVVDISDLTRWNTYGLKAIYPVLVEANRFLQQKGRPPIPIIGSKDRDVYQAVVERHEADLDKVEWFSSIDDFKQKYRL